MTAAMEVSYHRPVPSGAPLRLEGRRTGGSGRKHHAEARILNAQGQLLAASKALFIEIKPK